MDHFSLLVHHKSLHLIYVGAPVISLGEIVSDKSANKIKSDTYNVINKYIYIFYLNKGKFAKTSATLRVSDGDLSVMFDPPPSTEDVVHTGGDFIPFIMISKPAKKHTQLTQPNKNI